ncbi:putative virulence factor [Roseobacter litoralis]|uniref:putative virulence factor n=1 Tax=Roseobacter litoralis TaxID=42443 RepID=UPI0024926BB1|nr:putative virulence factor [Roseobacter litoralis]
MSENNILADRCVEVSQLTRDALAWVNHEENSDTVGPRHKSLTKLLRKSARRAERLGKSARTNMSVSVFGPSQAGKSFLVSVLARPTDGRLAAEFNGPGGQLDYISQVNPAGDGESTGLVTRFTMTKAATPDGFPIQLNLLSEADIARTIINSFYEDGDQSETPPEPEDLKAHFAAHTSKAGAGEVPGLSFEEIYEIAEYVENTFGKVAYASHLRGFWDEAASLAPNMSIKDRGDFLSILWGGYQPLTDLYVKLSSALTLIDNAEEVYAPLEALQPRETSIIDVNTLSGLFGPENEDTLPIRTPSGKVAQMNRAVVCALAAELVFPMAEQPSDFFAETDLLDFPGARNRFELPLTKTLENPEEGVTNMLLRGKVAYLFDRYVANQEITSMLLCVPDSNMDTVSLPGLVENWISMTHGATPQERAKNDCILFFVMTKFDKHLGESASGGSSTERFERRMDASLLKAFGKLRDSWVHKWTPSQPFQNCYWLRNPNYFVEGLINYNEDETEKEIRAEKLDRVAELKEGCLSTEAVTSHFKEPEVAWDAALTLNDGGVGYLTQELTKVCKPESKMGQISAQLDKMTNDVLGELRDLYVSDDIETRIEEKRDAAAQIIDCLELTLQSHRFGAFINALCVDQDAIEDRISRVPSSIRISQAVGSSAMESTSTGGAASPPRPGGASRPSRPGRPNRPGKPAPVAVEVDTDATAKTASLIRTMSSEDFQANTAIDIWIEHLSQLREDADRLATFSLTPEAAADLVRELVHGFRRTDVASDMKTLLKAIDYGLTVDKQAPPAAIVCAETINSFVHSLGAEKLSDKDRPVIELQDGNSRMAFEARPASDTAFDLPQEQRAAAEDFWTDWVYMLEALFVGNAKDGDAGEINIEQNMAIGRVVNGLDAEQAA